MKKKDLEQIRKIIQEELDKRGVPDFPNWVKQFEPIQSPPPWPSQKEIMKEAQRFDEAYNADHACLHDQCGCVQRGESHAHGIACPCPRCSPRC